MEWFFWFLFGFVSGGLVIYLITNLAKKQVQLTWYEWLLGILTTLLFVFMVETFVHSLAEMQVKAAWLSVLFMSVPTIIFGVITARSIRSRTAQAH